MGELYPFYLDCLDIKCTFDVDEVSAECHKQVFRAVMPACLGKCTLLCLILSLHSLDITFAIGVDKVSTKKVSTEGRACVL